MGTDGSRELQSCQPVLGARKGHGAAHLECHHVARTAQPGHQVQPAQPALSKGKSCLTSLTSSYDKVTCLLAEGEVVVVSAWISANPLVHLSLPFPEKLAAHGWDG